MSTKPESRLQRKIRKAILEEFPHSNWDKIHGGPYQAAGIPDLLGCVHGFYIALEVKMPDGKPPSEIQKAKIAKIKRAKGWASVIISEEEAINDIRSALALSKRTI